MYRMFGTVLRVAEYGTHPREADLGEVQETPMAIDEGDVENWYGSPREIT